MRAVAALCLAAMLSAARSRPNPCPHAATGCPPTAPHDRPHPPADAAHGRRARPHPARRAAAVSHAERARGARRLRGRRRDPRPAARAAAAGRGPRTAGAPTGTPLPARLYAASTAAGLPVLLYLHGGGFTVGSLETHDSLCRQLALRSGCAVLSLDYRLAPEHRFPMAVDDSWAALRWLADAARHARSRRRTARGRRRQRRRHAGGGARAARARPRHSPLALQVLITPGTTAHADTAVAPPVRQRLPARGGRHRLVLRPLHRPPATAPTGASRRSMPTPSTTWRRPAWCWPNAIRWSTKAWPMPTSCAPPACAVELEIWTAA